MRLKEVSRETVEVIAEAVGCRLINGTTRVYEIDYRHGDIVRIMEVSKEKFESDVIGKVEKKDLVTYKNEYGKIIQILEEVEQGVI